MNHMRRLIACLALLAPAFPAWSAYSCTFVANPNPLKITHSYFATVTGSGTLTMTCLRNPGTDGRRPWFWIGMDQTNAGATATQEGGTATVTYEVNHGSTTAGTWTNAGGVAANSTTDGAVRERQDFGGGNSADLTRTFTFYYRVPGFQFDPAGVYTDTLNITLRLDNAAGAVITTYAIPVHISIPDSCRFSTPPTPIDVNYTAFSPTAVTGVSNFAVTCTNGTNYTLALDRTRSIVPGVELAYTLGLSATTSTGTAVAQPYTVNISVDPGQAGRCNTGSCTGTDTRTLTVEY
jgi:spore coat protein U-like protein